MPYSRPTHSRMEMHTLPERTEAALEIEGLRKEYEQTVALDDLHLTVNRGEVFGFLGPNGAGKSTAVKCCLDLVRPGGRAPPGPPIPHWRPVSVGLPEPSASRNGSPPPVPGGTRPAAGRARAHAVAGRGTARAARPQPPRPAPLEGLLQGMLQRTGWLRPSSTT